MFGEASDTEIGDYFRSNLLATRGAIDQNDFKKFSALKTDGERVAFVLAYPEAHELEVESENASGKDADKALKLKEAGNKFFGRGDYIRALQTYSRAVLLAPEGDVAVLYANRSAALQRMQYHDLVLADIEEALKAGYPRELLYKLEERRAKSLLALKKHARAVEAFRNALTALDYAKAPLERKRKIESDIRMMLAVMEKGKRMNGATEFQDASDPKEGDRRVVPKVQNCNPSYPACSSAVEIRDAGGAIGRHAVATRNISPGEVLVVERPHSAVLLAEFRLTNCQSCFSRVIAPFPAACNTCSSVVYCSARCRERDAKAHRSECGLLTALWLSGASVTCLLAVKAITQRPFEQLLKLREQLEASAGGSKISKACPYKGDEYMTFHGLVTHEDERTSEDLFHRAYMAAWLLRLLKRTSYFPDAIKMPDAAEVQLSSGELFVAGLLLHNLQLLQFNAHEISELVTPANEKILAKSKSVFIGGGVYPTVALFNHSCNPGVIRYFVGTTMIVRALRTISAGQEICENYGPIFTTTPENERKRKLRLQYWFDCACEACTGHWPLLEEIEPTTLRFKCETGPECGNILLVKTDSNEFMVPCSKCKKSTNILKGLKALQDTDALYKVASRNLEEGHHERALKAYLEILKLLDETLALPIRDYHLCQQGVRLCLLTLGNVAVI